MYVIFFNDMDKSKIENNRVRWSIAHELGHIVLGHHSDKHTRLFRSSLSKIEYNQFEEEADMFASYILVPYIILYYQNITSKNDISEICKISPTAAKYRYDDFIIWLRRKRIEEYDKKILKLYNTSNINQKNIFCLVCGAITGYNETNYCYICGNKTRIYKKVNNNMFYKGIELDNNKRVIMCPICYNEQFGAEDVFCKICGFKLYNTCIGYTYNTCKHSEGLDGNARFCPYCGNETTFFRCRVLSAWDNQSNTVNETIVDEELPF